MVNEETELYRVLTASAIRREFELFIPRLAIIYVFLADAIVSAILPSFKSGAEYFLGPVYFVCTNCCPPMRAVGRLGVR